MLWVSKDVGRRGTPGFCSFWIRLASKPLSVLSPTHHVSSPGHHPPAIHCHASSAGPYIGSIPVKTAKIVFLGRYTASVGVGSLAYMVAEEAPATYDATQCMAAGQTLPTCGCGSLWVT